MHSNPTFYRDAVVTEPRRITRAANLHPRLDISPNFLRSHKFSNFLPRQIKHIEPNLPPSGTPRTYPEAEKIGSERARQRDIYD
jgi:hypothetical protein